MGVYRFSLAPLLFRSGIRNDKTRFTTIRELPDSTKSALSIGGNLGMVKSLERFGHDCMLGCGNSVNSNRLYSCMGKRNNVQSDKIH